MYNGSCEGGVMDMIQSSKKQNIFLIVLLSMCGFFIARVSLYGSIFVFSIGFYSVFISNRKTYIAVLISSIVGLLSLNLFFHTGKYIMVLLAMASIHMWCIYRDKRITTLGQAVLTGFIFAVIHMVHSLIIKAPLSTYFIGILEILVCFIITYVLSYFLKVLQPHQKRKISQEELIATVIVIALVITGIGGIMIGPVNVLTVISLGIILMVGYYYGVTAASTLGVILGVLINLAVGKDPLVITALALSGVVAGLFMDMGKYASVLAFTLVNLALYLYQKEGNVIYGIIIPLVIVDAIFMVVPMSWLKVLEGFFRPQDKVIDDKAYMNRVQSITMDRLSTFSRTFDQLAATFENISEKKMDLTKEDVSRLMDDVADQVCKYCQNIDHCWNKHFYSTYETIYSILKAADDKGSIEYKDIPAGFYKQCYKYKEFIKVTNKLYEIYRINLNWYNKVMDSRQIVSNQLKGVSTVMDKLSRDIKRDIQFELSIEEDLRIELEKYGIYVEEVLAYKDHNSCYNLDITLSKVYDNKKIMNKIGALVEEFLGKPCKLDRQHALDKKSMKLLFKERNLFKMTTGMASWAKEDMCGDNYTCSEMTMGRYLLALSDGMGTGLQAHKESMTTIELLEELLMTGFDNKTAVKMINSLLILKSIEDRFSTLDIALIDLQTGLCQLIKIGGAMIFIIRQNRVLAYESQTVPVGIVDKVELQTYDVQLKHGDMILMVTDGIVDSIEKQSLDVVEVITEALGKCHSKNPKTMSKKLLDQVMELTDGKPVDDMTMVIGRIWKERD